MEESHVFISKKKTKAESKKHKKILELLAEREKLLNVRFSYLNVDSTSSPQPQIGSTSLKVDFTYPNIVFTFSNIVFTFSNVSSNIKFVTDSGLRKHIDKSMDNIENFR